MLIKDWIKKDALLKPRTRKLRLNRHFRLAYHGLRAKDKSFNASMKTNFDKMTGRINIVPEEIGRVILNLINNAFHAVTERRRLSPNSYYCYENEKWYA